MESIYRDVQGLDDSDVRAEIKKEPMGAIFKANMDLQGKRSTGLTRRVGSHRRRAAAEQVGGGPCGIRSGDQGQNRTDRPLAKFQPAWPPWVSRNQKEKFQVSPGLMAEAPELNGAVA